MGQNVADDGTWSICAVVGASESVVLRLDHDTSAGTVIAEVAIQGGSFEACGLSAWETVRDYRRVSDRAGFDGACSSAWASVANWSTARRDALWSVVHDADQLRPGVKIRHHNASTSTETLSPALVTGDGSAIVNALGGSQAAFDAAVGSTAAASWYAAQNAADADYGPGLKAGLTAAIG